MLAIKIAVAPLLILVCSCSAGTTATDSVTSSISPPAESSQSPAATPDTSPSATPTPTPPARTLNRTESAALYFEKSCDAQQALEPVSRLIQRAVDDKHFEPRDYFSAVKDDALSTTRAFQDALESTEYAWTPEVATDIQERGELLTPYLSRLTGLLSSGRDSLQRAVTLINESIEESEPVADRIRVELDVPNNSECPFRSEVGEYEVYCGTGSRAERFPDYAEAWSRERSNCVTFWWGDTYDDTAQAAISTRLGKSFDAVPDAKKVSAIEELIARCAESDLSVWDYLDVKRVDRVFDTDSVESVFLYCPQHPNAETVLGWVANIKQQSEGGLTSFYNGLHRVGVDVRPGTYVSTGNSDGCYWERIDRNGQILDNYFSDGSRVQFTVYPGDFEVRTEFCNQFKLIE